MDGFDIDDLRRRFPLPDGVPDETVNRAQIGVALQVSENTISKWISLPENPMPVQEMGGNGREYAFNLGDCYAWRMWRDDQIHRQRDAGDRAAAQLAMAFRNIDDADDDGSRVLSAREIKEEADADYARNRAAELRRELVRVARVRDLFEDVLSQLRTTIVTMADFAEMEFGLKPEQVARLQRRGNQVLVQARLDLTRMIGQSDAAVIDLNTPREQAEMTV